MPADTIPSTAAKPHPADSLTDEQLEAIAREAEPPPAISKRLIVNQDDLENILREVELARAVVQTALQALRYMNVDESDDIAEVLSRHANDALTDPLDALRKILARVQS
jgi:hypothetical protein